MQSILPAVQGTTLEKLSRADFQAIQRQEWQTSRKNEQTVLDEIVEAVKKEQASVFVDYEEVAKRAYQITTAIYGFVQHSISRRNTLRDRIVSCRTLFNNYPGARFAETTFLYILCALEVIYDYDRVRCIPPEALRLLSEMRHDFHQRHDTLVAAFREARAINVYDASSFIDTQRFQKSLAREVLDTGASGPAKARALRRLWPQILDLGLMAGRSFIDGWTLSVGFLTFHEVEQFFAEHPELCVLGYLKNLAVAHLTGSRPVQAGIGPESIDKRWRREVPIHSPSPPLRAYPGKLSPIDLTQPESCRQYLSTSQYRSFLSPTASPSQKVISLKILWAKVPEVGIVVGDIASCSGLVIDDAFITFPKSSVSHLERFFASLPPWRSYDFANLLGFCLRQKQTILLGGGLSVSDPGEDRNYWIASRICTVEQAIKHSSKIYSAWLDERRIFSAR